MWYADSLVLTLGRGFKILSLFTMVFTIASMCVSVYKWFKPGYWETRIITKFMEIVPNDVMWIVPFGSVLLFAIFLGWYGVQKANAVLSVLTALIMFGCSIYIVWYTIWRFANNKYWQYFQMFFSFYNNWAPFSKKRVRAFDFVAMNIRHECCGRHSWEDFFSNVFKGITFHSVKQPLPYGCCPLHQEHCWQWKATKRGCQWALKLFFYKYLHMARFCYFMLSIILILTTGFAIGHAVALSFTRYRYTRKTKLKKKKKQLKKNVDRKQIKVQTTTRRRY